MFVFVCVVLDTLYNGKMLTYFALLQVPKEVGTLDYCKNYCDLKTMPRNHGAVLVFSYVKAQQSYIVKNQR